MQQAQKIAELNPINWTAKQVQHYYKKNPPGNVQEQAQANAAFELKKRQENALTSQIVGEEPPEITPRPVDINIPGAVIDRISKSPLIQNLKTIPLAGPVSPGFIESQIAPGRAILAPYAELAKETPFKLAGVTALPFVDPEIFDDIDKKLGNAILGYTSPGQEITKEALGPLAELDAFAATQAGTVGTLSSFLEAAGILQPEKAGESAGSQLIGTQLEIIASPNLLRLVDYPLRVRYKLADDIFY